MEQSLIDKFNQNNLDEVDKDMIMARVKYATNKLLEECSNSVERIHALLEEYSVEAKMAGISCIVLAQCRLFHKNDGESDVSLVLGSSSRLEAMMEHEKGDLIK